MDSIWTKYKLFTGALFFALAIVGALGVVDATNIYATASTLTLSIDNSTVSVDIAALNAQGSFKKSSASTISASTDNATGYTLGIAGSGGADNGNLINTDDNTSKLTSITDATTEEQFGALNGTAYNNMWGYLPSKHCADASNSVTCTANTDFLPAPASTGDILDVTSSANITPNEYELAIGARVDSSIKIGAYVNTFNVVLVANSIPYTVVFDDNVVSNMPTDIDSTSPTESVTLPSNVPVRDGYVFLGWCSVIPTKSGSADTCAGGTQYPASGTYTLDQTGTNNLHLYAMWKEPLTMQNMTLAQCPTTPEDAIDSRDGQTYKVAKLADGKCWMVENLNLAGGTALDADKTDVTSAYISSFTTSNNLTKNGNTIVLPASSTSGFNTANYSYVYNSGNKTNCGASGQNTPCYSYYSWDAATLGSGRTIATDNTDAQQSICPKGWKLPTSRTTSASNWQTTSDFYAMAHQYGLDSTTSTSESDNGFYTQAGPGTTPSFLLAGNYDYGSFKLGGSLGFYWSSTSNSNSSYARFLFFSSSYVYSADGYSRYAGFSVRCILGS